MMKRTISKFNLCIFAAAVLLNFLVVAALAMTLLRSYRDREAYAEVSAQNILLMMEQHLADSFEQVDVTLQSLAEEAQRNAVAGAFEEQQLTAMLEPKKRRILGVSSLGIADHNGRILAATNSVDGQPRRVDGHEHFESLRDNSQPGMRVGRLQQSSVNQEWSIPLGRRINRPDGSFAGIVYALVSINYLQQLSGKLDLGERGSIVLRDDQFAMAYRYPARADFSSGSREVSPELQERILGGELRGRYKAIQPVDRVERLFVFSRVRSYPYFWVVGLAPMDYLGVWRNEAWQMLIMAALFMAASVLSVRLILRQRAKQQAVRTALEENENKLSAILNNMGASIFAKDKNYAYVFANRAVLDFAGMNELEEIVGLKDEQFRPAETAERLLELDRRVFETGQTVRAVTHLRSRSGRIKHTLAVRMPMRRPDGRIYALCGVSTDITELVKMQRRESIRNQMLEMLARNEDVSRTLDGLLRAVETEEQGLHCGIVLIDDRPGSKPPRLVVAPGLPDSVKRFIDGTECSEKAGPIGLTSFDGPRFIVSDIQSDPVWVDARGPLSQINARSFWGEPIRLPTGCVAGVFVVFREQVGSPSADEVKFIESAATLIGIAVERQRNDAELKIAGQVFEASQEAIMVTDEANRIIAVNSAFTQISGYSRAEVLGASPKLLSSGRQDDAFYQGMWSALQRCGSWQGELWNRRKNGELYAEWLSIQTVEAGDGSGLRHIALFADITERKHASELAWRHANFDLLTQLPNRRLFFDRLENEILSSKRDSSRMALLFIDLDDFKRVNDMVGHDTGDLLLLEASQRLLSVLRETDTVARLGGDEFALILRDVEQAQDVERVAHALVDVLQQPYQLSGRKHVVTASIGISIYPDDSTDADSLLRNANQGMHTAKAQGNNRFSYFTAAMQQEAEQRRSLLMDMHTALEQRQFQLHYQPIVDMHTGTISKLEALLRWCHPSKGMISPALFIPLAEENGLIHGIGEWVFHEAMRQTQEWRTRTGQALQTSVNVSPLQFARSDFPEQWIGYLRQQGVDGSALILEITEGVLINHRTEVARKLNDLRDANISVAVDDFGTGYSSLSYLKRFAIDVLKIDQSFVRDMATDGNSLALVEAIIVMAHKLGLKVVAEGVETSEQCGLLMDLCCDYAQGYYFSRPLCAADFEQLLPCQFELLAA